MTSGGMSSSVKGLSGFIENFCLYDDIRLSESRFYFFAIVSPFERFFFCLLTVTSGYLSLLRESRLDFHSNTKASSPPDTK